MLVKSTSVHTNHHTCSMPIARQVHNGHACCQTVQCVHCATKRGGGQHNNSGGGGRATTLFSLRNCSLMLTSECSLSNFVLCSSHFRFESSSRVCRAEVSFCDNWRCSSSLRYASYCSLSQAESGCTHHCSMSTYHPLDVCHKHTHRDRQVSKQHA